MKDKENDELELRMQTLQKESQTLEEREKTLGDYLDNKNMQN